MPRPIENVTIDERGGEHHPAFGMIGASRVSSSPPGAVLFDSDIRHQHSVIVRIATAYRKRDLHRDWKGADRRIVEVEMSEAQWASFVSSMNVGDGVPCTIRGREGDPQVAGLPFDSRMQATMDEVRTAAHDAAAAVAEAFAAYKKNKTADNLRTLQARIENMPANLEFAASSLTRHTEEVVQKARADIEAFVVTKAVQMGLEPSSLGMAGLLSAAPEDDA